MILKQSSFFFAIALCTLTLRQAQGEDKNKVLMLSLSKHGIDQFMMPAPCMAFFTWARAFSLASPIGRRMSGVQRPSSDTAYFTGEGFVSQNMASCSGISRS